MNLASLVNRQLIVHFSSEHGLFCSRDHSIFKYHYASGKLKFICELPAKPGGLMSTIKHKIARSSIRQWFKPHLGIEHLVVTTKQNLVMVYDQIYIYSSSSVGRYANVCQLQDLTSFAGPLRGGIALHPGSDMVYFGEYLNNHQSDIRVLRIDSQQNVATVCWAFPRSDIKHIHAINYDPYRNRLWITTGDADHESALYYTDDEFQSVHKFAGGDQSWRAISLLFFPDAIEWGMDAGKDAPASAINHIYRYEFASQQRVQVATIGNPAYAAVQCADGGAFMATTYEPGRLQDTPEQAALWYRSPDGRWQQVLALDYRDSQMPTVSRYGMLYLPAGTVPARQLLFTTLNCSQRHLACYSLNCNS